MLRFQSVSVLVAASAFLLTACPKNEEPGDTTGGDEASDETDEGGDEKGDDGNTDAGFIPADDIPNANTCDPWLQDCPEGEKCAAYAVGNTWDATKCVEVMGDGLVGDECVYNGAVLGTDDCAKGHMCYYTNEEAVGICVAQCTGSPDNPVCDDGFNCSMSNSGSLLLCLYGCNPLIQDCEVDGSGCFYDGTLFNCDPAGDLMEGEVCGFINDCAAGNFCADAAALPTCAGSSCCSGFCDLDDPICTITDTECVAFFEEASAPPGLENVGLCILPG